MKPLTRSLTLAIGIPLPLALIAFASPVTSSAPRLPVSGSASVTFNSSAQSPGTEQITVRFKSNSVNETVSVDVNPFDSNGDPLSTEDKAAKFKDALNAKFNTGGHDVSATVDGSVMTLNGGPGVSKLKVRITDNTNEDEDIEPSNDGTAFGEGLLSGGIAGVDDLGSASEITISIGPSTFGVPLVGGQRPAQAADAVVDALDAAGYSARMVGVSSFIVDLPSSTPFAARTNDVVLALEMGAGTY
ncbi:MAG: hypothetical protein AAFZ65_08365 [Planctomycetota bacterium]